MVVQGYKRYRFVDDHYVYLSALKGLLYREGQCVKHGQSLFEIGGSDRETP